MIVLDYWEKSSSACLLTCSLTLLALKLLFQAAERVCFECGLMKVGYGKGFVGCKGVKTKGEMKIKNNRCRNRGDPVQILALLLIIAGSCIQFFRHRF